jgi:hypothetical protein
MIDGREDQQTRARRRPVTVRQDPQPGTPAGDPGGDACAAWAWARSARKTLEDTQAVRGMIRAVRISVQVVE